MDLLIGLDVGTSAVKGVLVSADGEKLAVGRRENRFLRPEPGWVELDPEEHYRTVCDLLRELASRVPRGGGRTGRTWSCSACVRDSSPRSAPRAGRCRPLTC